MTTLFFSLIHLSLGTANNLSHQPSADEWSELYRMAAKQSLMGVCFAGVRRYLEHTGKNYTEAGIPKKVYHQWIATVAHIQDRNELMNQRCVELQSKLSSSGLNSSILKGQGIATLYGELKDFRQPGDIDVYVDCGRKKAIEYARSIGQEFIDWDYKHLHLEVFKDTEVEMHYRPDVSCNPFRNPRLQRFWVQQKQEFFKSKVVLGCGDIICPSDTMRVFFLIHHIYRHVISGGIGLRQVMDLYFALGNRNSAEDDILKGWIKKNGLTKVSKALMWILVTVFGANGNLLPWKTDEKEGQFLLDEIMIGGNFGKADKRYGTANSRLSILLKVFKRNMHLVKHYGCEALFAPLYYIWHFCWKRLVKKY